MSVNARYKDSVFSFLFSDPALLRELYGALAGTELPPGVPVAVNTLRNVLFLGPVNDISFEVGGKLVVLVEHQSTINPNMALRLFLYLAKIYERAVKDRNLYGSKLVRVPRPEFWVLYNGAAAYPERQTLRLSDAYEEAGWAGVSGVGGLELEVRVLNINGGQNGEVLRRCRTLGEYSAFIDKVRGYTGKGGDREKAMRSAVAYCREHGILEEFLGKHGGEVMNMLLEEYTVEDAMALMREESLAEGLEQGRGEAIGSLMVYGMTPEQISRALNLPLETVIQYQARQP